eukprot:g272.t1
MSRCPTPPTAASPLPFHGHSPIPTFRNLGPEQLAGVIFTCTEDSLDDCLKAGVFGLPRTHFQYVQHVRPSMVLFLFNFSTRELHGIFRAIAGGKIDKESQGVKPDWAAKFPAQVDVDTSDTYAPLPESAFRRVIAENYVSSVSSQFSFELDMEQVARLSDAFKQFAANGTIPNTNNSDFTPFDGNNAQQLGTTLSLWEQHETARAPPWATNNIERTKRFSPIGLPPIRDPFIPGRPKSSMEHLTGHTSHFETDFSLLGSGLGDFSNTLSQKPRLSLDVNMLQMNQLGDLLGGGGGTLMNSVDFGLGQTLQNSGLIQDTSSWTQDLDQSAVSVPGGMLSTVSGDTASSQLINQTQIALGLNAPTQGLRGRLSTGNLTSVDSRGGLWSPDPSFGRSFALPGQSLDPTQVSSTSDISFNSDDKQGSKIWKVTSNDINLIPDIQNIYSGGFKFPEKSQMTTTRTIGGGGNPLQRAGASNVQEYSTLIGRYQETWGGSNAASWKPPRPHSSAEGDLSLFTRNNLLGLNTMYPDSNAEVNEEGSSNYLQSQNQPLSGKFSVQNESHTSEKVTGMIDSSPSETAESPIAEQVNIRALEDESMAINQYDEITGAFQNSELSLEQPPIDKGSLFGLSSEGYCLTPEDMVSNGELGFINEFTGGRQSLQSGYSEDYGDLLPPGEPSFALPNIPSIGLDISPVSGLGLGLTTSTNPVMNLESGMNDKVNLESNPLLKQIPPVKHQKPLDFATIHSSSKEAFTLTDVVLIGGLTDSSTVKVLDLDSPEQIKNTKLNLSFCRGAGTNIGTHVFLMGGINPDDPNKPTTALYRMEPLFTETNEAKELASMNIGRCLFGSVSAGMKIFAIGGNTEQGPTNTVEIYDPILDTWTVGPSLNTAKHSLGTAVVNNMIYAVGGQSEKGALQTVEMLDPREGKWIQIGSLSWSRAGLTCCPVANHLFAAGGHNGKTVVSSGEILDLRKGIVNESLTLIEPRQYGVALSIENSVYLFGGLQSSDLENGLKYSRPEIFNTKLSTSVLWSEVSEEQLSLVFHSACAIPRCLY